ncbi:copper chaperone PCu(A)C [Spongiibacter sp.]|uniref:copper chaperone PCu(A)C n=1 Tax=Spongiibacter sp. TaxID=2024860 RepID=UPI0035624ED0
MTRNSLFWLMCLLPLSSWGVDIHDAYVRGLPPGQKNTAAFFSLHNPASLPVTLRAGSSDIADRLEIHSHAERNGMMSMRRQDAVTIGSGERLHFAPGGYHLMLINLRRPLRDGEQVSFSLLTEGGDTLQIDATVRSVLNEASPAGHHHHQRGQE